MTETQQDKIRCDACPVLCYIREGLRGACDRYANEGGRLVSLVPGRMKVELFAESATKFFVTDVDAEIEFVADASGRVTGLVLRQGGETITGKRIQ